ncbi:MAG TPA: Sir2 family NAD-dependent protein deacetylase [Gemmataceae bacterium]|nr:Sir2 family NAD-dependent protein deacetylase [Gemmataceae bacterium]
MDHAELYSRAAREISSADALLIGAGAGMGVDSGLPDFRGNEGFWKAYPPFKGRPFASMSNPQWFVADPQLAWGFMGHRMQLYRDTTPHAGFDILLRWASRMPAGFFVFTSNVDGQFQKAGFPDDRIIECHGSIHHLQCLKLCRQSIWSARDTRVTVDMSTVRATSALPRCPHCNGFARPNVLMFGDWGWLADRSEKQYARYHAWLREVRGKKVVAIEMGAGLAIPTVRIECEQRATALIRVNPRDPDVPAGAISLPVGALAALSAIDPLTTSRLCAP